MHDRTPWKRGRTGSFELKNGAGKLKTYNNLTEFVRECATCGKPFGVYVTEPVAEGRADSNSFGLKNCEEHRRAPVRGEAVTDDSLRMANNTMREELAGLYQRNSELFAELQHVKARLAQYELGPAMEAFSAAARPLTFPWENT